MNVLLIGGNRFLGIELGFRLLAAGHTLTLLNRGNRPDPFGQRVERLVADRSTDTFDQVLQARTFDAVIDLALFTGAEARRAARALHGRVGHWVMVSTGQVYLVRQNYQPNAREDFYDGPLIPPPADERNLAEWQYGAEKRAAEDVVLGSGIPSTRLRIPMVHGLGDYYRRIESVLCRLLDGGPLLVPNANHLARHVYAPAVARVLQQVLGDPRCFGKAWNVCQDETPTVLELVQRIASCLGVVPMVLQPTSEQLLKHGLHPVDVCPFSGTWMSCLDPSAVKRDLGLVHEPLSEYLPGIVHGLLQKWPSAPPESLKHRATELQIARALAS